jgi:hypothetical protein
MNQSSNEIAVLKYALEESVKMQSHYATLLNMRDGGSRLTFATSDAWLRRLEELELTRVARAMAANPGAFLD